jgi:hypothetical protein
MGRASESGWVISIFMVIERCEGIFSKSKSPMDSHFATPQGELRSEIEKM